MNHVDLLEDKKFIGQEFLTWIWFQSEVNSGIVDVKGYGAVEVWFEDRIMLESGSGNTRQSVTCQGKDMDLAEARTALREGKKVSQARIRLAVEEREYHFSVKAEGLELNSIKGPKTLDYAEEEDDALAGRLLDRVAVFRELTNVMDSLFGKFLSIRLTRQWDETEVQRIRNWLSS